LLEDEEHKNAFRRLRDEDPEFKASLGYTASLRPSGSTEQDPT
jgi:hypothetical protein